MVLEAGWVVGGAGYSWIIGGSGARVIRSGSVLIMLGE